jgi:hypothetical protein
VKFKFFFLAKSEIGGLTLAFRRYELEPNKLSNLVITNSVGPTSFVFYNQEIKKNMPKVTLTKAASKSVGYKREFFTTELVLTKFNSTSNFIIFYFCEC